MKEFEKIINDAWDNKENINEASNPSIVNAIKETIKLLDSGKVRVAEKKDGADWETNQWVKKAILLSFKVNQMQTLAGPYATWWDKVKGKTAGWTREDHQKAGFRMVPNGVVRYGSYIAKGVVLMPSFVNIGGYVDSGTMVDTWASVGSGAQIGKNVHLSGGVGIGGVLEPVQAGPTIIEDDCFIGARSEIVEGVIVRKGSVISMGCYIGKSTKIVNRKTDEITMGEIKEGSVVVPGTLPDKNDPKKPSLYCVVIIKQVDEKTRSKTSINDLLRD
jgi:2,3,4,5-tetrahydropyridine-2,6-dicarboxylate N-succinyltransferase